MEKKKTLKELLQEYAPNVEITVKQPVTKNECKEGSGRSYGAGGEACDYCPHCYGNKDWCPYMD